MDPSVEGFRTAAIGRYTEMQYILVCDLRELLEAPMDRSERPWLLAILDALLDTLPEQFQLQEEGGFMTEVLEEFPNWHREVEHLRGEHKPLCESLAELRKRVALDEDFEDVAERLRAELRDWVQRLLAYNRHERRLVQTAMNLEVGVGD